MLIDRKSFLANEFALSSRVGMDHNIVTNGQTAVSCAPAQACRGKKVEVVFFHFSYRPVGRQKP